MYNPTIDFTLAASLVWADLKLEALEMEPEQRIPT